MKFILWQQVRYVELNPVKARLVSKPDLWNYSSATSHVNGKDDTLLSRTSLLNEMIDDWKEFFSLTTSEQDIKILQQHERTGRPLGNDGFLTRLEKSIGRSLKPKRPGRKPKKAKKYVWCPLICDSIGESGLVLMWQVGVHQIS